MNTIKFDGAQVCAHCDLIHSWSATVCTVCSGALTSLTEFWTPTVAQEQQIVNNACDNCDRQDCSYCDFINPNDLRNTKIYPCHGCYLLDDQDSTIEALEDRVEHLNDEIKVLNNEIQHLYLRLIW